MLDTNKRSCAAHAVPASCMLLRIHSCMQSDLLGMLLQMTKDRMILLEGQEGSLKTIGIPEMTWIFTPGHSPGHVVYKHTSGILLGGDFADVLKVDGKHALKVMCPVTCDLAMAKKSICKIAQDLDYSKILPYHDSWKTGYTKAELLPLAKSYAGCA